jgi:hypothetical protein
VQQFYSFVNFINFGAIVGNTAGLSIFWERSIVQTMKKIQLFIYIPFLFVQNIFAQSSTDLDGIIPSGDSDDQALNALSDRVELGSLEIKDVLFFIVKLIDLVSALAGTLCVIMLLYGGFQYMMSGLNDDKESAKKTLRYAIIGLIVSFLAYLIINLIFAQFTGEGMSWSADWRTQ